MKDLTTLPSAPRLRYANVREMEFENGVAIRRSRGGDSGDGYENVFREWRGMPDYKRVEYFMDAITKFPFFTQLNLNLCALLSFHFREGCFRKTGEAAPH